VAVVCACMRACVGGGGSQKGLARARASSRPARRWSASGAKRRRSRATQRHARPVPSSLPAGRVPYRACVVCAGFARAYLGLDLGPPAHSVSELTNERQQPLLPTDHTKLASQLAALKSLARRPCKPAGWEMLARPPATKARTPDHSQKLWQRRRPAKCCLCMCVDQLVSGSRQPAVGRARV
jgi:hypothetical protein